MAREGRRRSASDQPHRLHRSGNTEDRDHALEVVSQNAQAHLGADVLDASSQEVRPTHPVLEGPEHVFDGRLAHEHRLGLPVQPLLHLLKNRFVLPAPYAPFVPGRALSFQGALRAYRGPVHLDPLALLDARVMPAQVLPGRASIDIVSRYVDEVVLTNRPSAFAPEVIGFDTYATMPSSSQALISAPA